MANKKVRSIRGEEVDFDLLRVKQTIENRNKPDSVEMREKYIDIRRRRNPRRNVADLVDEQRQNEQDAREKIQKSREAKQLAAEAKANEPEEKVVKKATKKPAVEEKVEATPAAAAKPPAQRSTSKRKVVNRTQD